MSQQPVQQSDKSPSGQRPPLFSSRRERRLWGWALAAVVAIYSTLGLAATLAQTLQSEWLIGAVFVAGFALILAMILTQGLKTRPRGVEIGVALGVVAVYLLVIVRLALPPAERTHLIEYGVVGVLIYEALAERAGNGRSAPLPPLLAILITGLLGVGDEVIQGILPNRFFETTDILVNIMAGGMAILASATLGWARRWTSRRASRP